MVTRTALARVTWRVPASAGILLAAACATGVDAVPDGVGDGADGGPAEAGGNTEAAADAARDAGAASDGSASDGAPSDAAAADGGPADAGVADANTTRALVFTGAANTPQYGNLSGGTLYDDACLVGEALIGFAGSLSSASGYHQRISAQCGRAARIGAPGAYTVKVTPGSATPPRGALPGTSPWTRTCPADQVVTGFSGRNGTLIDQLTFTCSPFVVDTTGAVVAPGAPTALPAIGGPGGTAFAQTDCGAGRVATVVRLRAGDSLDAFGLACSSISVAP